jgi:hypothetical protein
MCSVFVSQPVKVRLYRKGKRKEKEEIILPPTHWDLAGEKGKKGNPYVKRSALGAAPFSRTGEEKGKGFALVGSGKNLGGFQNLRGLPATRSSPPATPSPQLATASVAYFVSQSLPALELWQTETAMTAQRVAKTVPNLSIEN